MSRPIHFTVEGGRLICADGSPFISIRREGETSPTIADEVTYLITRYLNAQSQKDSGVLGSINQPTAFSRRGGF